MWMSVLCALTAIGPVHGLAQLPHHLSSDLRTTARSVQRRRCEQRPRAPPCRLYAASDPDGLFPEDSDNNISVTDSDEIRNSRAGADAGEDSSIDWDNAWAAKQADIKKAAEVREATKVARPAFSGRSEIIVTGNEKDGYEFIEIAANGSRRNDGGFKLDDDETRGGQARKDIMARELQLVENVAFDKVFQVGGLVLAVLLALMINVYNSGGITNGATRFAGMDMPMYEDRPVAVPHPSNQYYPDQATNSDLVI